MLRTVLDEGAAFMQERWDSAKAGLPLPRFPDPGADPAASGVETVIRDVVRELSRGNKSREDAAGANKGTLASIGREEGQLVFMARACDNLTVNLCQATVEKEAFQALRMAGQNMMPSCAASSSRATSPMP